MAPVSPVKRITRARAASKKISTTNDMNEQSRKAVVTKAAAARKAKIEAHINEPEIEAPPSKQTTSKRVVATPLAVAPRRRVKVVPLEIPVIEPEPIPEDVVQEPQSKAATTRLKKAATTVKPKTPVATGKDGKNAPITKSRSRKNTAAEEKVEVASIAPKTRGRPKKTAEPQQVHLLPVEEPVRQTRTRAGSEAAATQPSASSVPKAITAPRKKVTFQDLPESDKENVPLASKRAAGKKGAAATGTGMRAKPVRKPAAAGTKRKAPTSKTKNDTPAPRALTPKKITQVTRSSSPNDSEEDELNGGKTPVRDLSMSPRRLPTIPGLSSPVKKLDFTQALQPKSPKMSTGALGMLSPARRLPSSPFKDALKDSPKRGNAVPIFPVHNLQPNTGSVLAASSTSHSTLLQSPKRGPLDSSIFALSAMKAQKSPFKASLLQSPARRLFSPQKQKPTSATPAKSEISTPTAFKSPDTAISCHFRASPERFGRVHTLTEEELAREAEGMVDFDQSVLNIQSPIKLAKALPASLTTADEDDEQKPTVESYTKGVADRYTAPDSTPAIPAPEVTYENSEASDPETMEGIATSVTASEVEVQPAEVPATNIFFRASRFRDDDESSEDELQGDMTPDRSFAAGGPRLSAADIRSRLSTGISGVPQGMGFTPLATQLNGWLASSPEKKCKEPQSQSSWMFSPLATQHIPGEVMMSRRSTPQQLRTSGGPRQSRAARQSTDARKSVGSRLSLASSMGGTPGESFFAEEMALRELEEHFDEQDSFEEHVDLHKVGGNVFEEPMSADCAQDEAEGMPEDLPGNDTTQDDIEHELTTDLVNQITYTDTALVDVAALAKEAEALAPASEKLSEDSSSSVYGDENVVPVDLDTVQAEQGPQQPTMNNYATAETLYLTPVLADDLRNETQTPVRPDPSLPRFVNTVVSKVPLRPEGFASPIKMPKKRSRSLSGVSSPAKRPLFSVEDLRMPNSNTAILFSPERRVRSACPSPAASTPGERSFAVNDFGDSTLDGIELPEDEIMSSDDEFLQEQGRGTLSSVKSTLAAVQSSTVSPARTPLKVFGNGVLHGAVVHVDVHTTEGADASGIFVELLTQMGAKCVKDWRWNPRTSIAASGDDAGRVAGVAATPAKIGITHVVYKDGGKRTLEKVRDAKGEVWCIGVGWVLDCERENKWLDESAYSVDTSIIPRGGSRRRKSMEPRALMNANGSLGVVKGRRSVSGDMTAKMREELVNTPVRLVAGEKERDSLDSNGASNSVDSTFSTPTGLQSAFKTSVIATGPEDEDEDGDDDSENLPAVATPTGFVDYDPATSMTPATLGRASKMVQMSAPPKQTGKGLFEDVSEKENENGRAKGGFPVTGNVEDERDGAMRKRLEAARRRTMGWRPRVGSPLGRI